jgi:hypothetical protein
MGFAPVLLDKHSRGCMPVSEKTSSRQLVNSPCGQEWKEWRPEGRRSLLLVVAAWLRLAVVSDLQARQDDGEHYQHRFQHSSNIHFYTPPF